MLVFLTHKRKYDEKYAIAFWQYFNHINFELSQVCQINSNNSFTNYSIFSRVYDYHDIPRVILTCHHDVLRICLNLAGSEEEDLVKIVRAVIRGLNSINQGQLRINLFMIGTSSDKISSDYFTQTIAGTKFLSNDELPIGENQEFDDEVIHELFKDGPETQINELEDLIYKFWSNEFDEQELVQEFWIGLLERNKAYYLELESYTSLRKHKSGYNLFIQYHDCPLVIPVHEIMNHKATMKQQRLGDFETRVVQIFKRLLPGTVQEFFQKHFSFMQLINFVVAEQQCRQCGEFLSCFGEGYVYRLVFYKSFLTHMSHRKEKEL